MRDRDQNREPSGKSSPERPRAMAHVAAGMPFAAALDRLGNRGLLRAARSIYVQRTCACGAGMPCATCPAGQQGTVAAAAPASGEVPAIVADVVSSPGSPLDRGLREGFEARLGTSLGDVRVHTDSRAAASARAVQAVAYTVGSHVAFDEGRFAPGTQAGDRLLAHELIHVAQQGRGVAAARGVSQPNDPAEVEADRLADAVAHGERVSVRPAVGVAEVHRAPNPASCGTQFRNPLSSQRVLVEKRGNLEHLLVQIDFMGTPGRIPMAEFSIPGASKSGSGNEGYADVIDKKTLEVFEIKPDSLQLMAQTEAQHYANHATSKCGGVWKPGASYTPNRDPIWELKVGNASAKLRASFGQAGAIVYRWEFSGMQVKWKPEWLELWARAEALKRVFGLEPLTAQGVPITVTNALATAGGALPEMAAVGAATMGTATILTMNAVLKAEGDFVKAVTGDLGARTQAMTGTTILLLMNEEAFAASAAGAALLAQTVSTLQVKSPDPVHTLFRETMLAIIGGMAVAWGSVAIGGLIYLAAPFIAAGAASLATAAAAHAATATGAIRAMALAIEVAAKALPATAGATMLMWASNAAAATPTVHAAPMRYAALPMFTDVTSLPTTVNLGGVNHTVIGSALVK